MEKTVVLDHLRIKRIIDRFAHQIIENFHQEKEVVIIGIDKRGYILADRIARSLEKNSEFKIELGKIKLNKKSPQSDMPELDIPTDALYNKVVLLVDDVLNTGLTLIHSIAFLIKQNPKTLRTIVLVDRIHRQFPVRADHVGLTLSTNLKEHVNVQFEPENDHAYLS